MNRRKFVLSASAGLALIGNSAFAQRRGSAASVLTSELTGGEIDTSGSSLQLNNQHMEESDGSEHFHFVVKDGSQFDIIIWPQSSGDAGEFMQSQADMYSAVLGNVEVIGEDTYDDGGWLAFDFGNLAYYEYQLGAYPGHDLVIMLTATPETFGDLFEQAQAILVDGFEPFLFTEESDIVAVAAARATASSTTTTTTSSRSSRRSSGTTATEEVTESTRSSRSSRGETTTATEEATESTRSSRSSRGETTTATEEAGSSRTSGRSSSGGGDPVETVRAHRNTFLDSYDEFFVLLQTAADETTSESEFASLFDEMVTIARDWQGYPDEAAAVSFGAEHAELEAVYLDWADLVRELGFAFEDIFQGVGSTDDFLDVYDQWSIVDAELLAILRQSGQRFLRQAMSRNTVARGLAVV